MASSAVITLARPLAIGTFNPSSLHIIGVTNSNYLYTKTIPPKIEIQISYVGCVKDSIHLTKSGEKFNTTLVEKEP